MTQIPTSVALTVLAGAFLLASSLDYQDQLATATEYCRSRGMDFNQADGNCQKRIRPECEPARHHKPTTTRTIPEYCYATPNQSR